MSESEIVVVLADWCPNSLEYKVVTNILKQRCGLNFKYMLADDINVRAIPATIFCRAQDNTVVYGYMTCADFLSTYNRIMSKRLNSFVRKGT